METAGRGGSERWGQGYRIVMGKLKKQGLKISAGRRMNMLNQLFECDNNRDSENSGHLSIKVLKALARGEDGTIERLFTKIIRSDEFPSEWKVAEVILIKKPGKDGEEATASRPICLIPSMDKVF
ncbi:hypothetical protein HHI36_011218 [Cryptolaemus montrouzieri]|uniref:Uncharacterized protein n=1 Tax=Cryptolaemus montrouzieri TaxID=559131 RepID=A0ABD2ML41_9CUCU